MLGNCPIKNSKEWKEILAFNNGNEQRALEEWEEIYGQDELLNSDPDFSSTPEEFEDASVAEAFEEPSFQKSLKKIKIYLETKRNELSKKKVLNQKEKKIALNRIIKNLKSLEEVESINAFVDFAYEELIDAKKLITEAYKKHLKGETTSKEFLDIISSANQVANGYSILDEISKDDIDRYFSRPSEGVRSKSDLTPQQKISESMKIKNDIRIFFEQKVVSLIAEKLINYRSKRGDLTIEEQIAAYERRIDELEKSDLSDRAKQREIKFNKEELEKWRGMQLDKEKLQALLLETANDESFFQAWLDPLISSGDVPLSLFAKMVKSQFEETRIEDIEVRNKISDALKSFSQKTGRSIGNVEKLNEGLFEFLRIPVRDVNGKVIRDKETNEIIFEEVVSFVQKYNMNKFGEALRDFSKSNPKPKLKEDATDIEKQQHEKALTKWYESRRQWFDRNTQPKSKEERDKVINEKRKDLADGIITDEEYGEWLRSVERTKDGEKKYYGELSEPSDKYLNDAWLKLYNREGKPISPQGEYHKILTDEYLQSQELLPEGQRPGLIVPSIEMDDVERRQRFGIKKAIKSKLSESYQRKKYDQSLYGETAGQTNEIDDNVYGIGRSSNEKFDIIPVFFTQKMDKEDVSVDLASSVIQFGAMARRFNSLNEIQSEIYAFQKTIGNRKIAAKDSKGKPIIDAIAKKLGYEEYIGSNAMDYSQFHLDEFINMVIKGESQKASQFFKLDLGKITNTAIGISAVTTLSLDVLKGVANNLQGNFQLIIEAAGSEFFSLKNLTKAKSLYWGGKLAGCLSDFGKPYPESWLGKLIEYYDAIQGKFKDEYGKDVSATVAQKLFRTNTLFFTMHAGEHELQSIAMLALMDATKVIDKETGKEISLLDAHQKYGTYLFDTVTDENGNKEKKYKVQIRTNKSLENPEGDLVDYDEKQRIEHTNILHALNKRMHGVYNEFDKSVLQKYSIGRLLIMYRKYLVPGYKRRYKEVSFDDELGTPTEGFYRTFYKTMLRDLRTYKLNILSRWKQYTKFEKMQIRKVIAEMTLILASLAVILALTWGDDDDKKKKKETKSYFEYFFLYQAMRMRSETFAYLNPRDAYKALRSPSAMTGTIDRGIKFIDQILPWNINEKYKRKEGVYEKGDNKAWARFQKLMGFSGYNLNPEAAIKSWEASFL